MPPPDVHRTATYDHLLPRAAVPSQDVVRNPWFKLEGRDSQVRPASTTSAASAASANTLSPP
jgi:hypothetical protein